MNSDADASLPTSLLFLDIPLVCLVIAPCRQGASASSVRSGYFLTDPFTRNPRKRLVRSSKIHFVDPGVHRSLTGRRGPCTGEEFESYVVAEIWKQAKTASLNVHMFHLRTHDGREVDLLIETEDGFVAIEIKAAERVAPTDARHLRGVAELLGEPVLLSLVLSMDRDARMIGDGILALPAAWALGPSGGPR